MCTDSIYIDDTSQISCSAKTDLKSECRALKTNLGGAGSFKILRVTHLSLPGGRWEVGIRKDTSGWFNSEVSWGFLLCLLKDESPAMVTL